MQELKAHLKRMKAIEPDRSFAVRAKYEILARNNKEDSRAFTLPAFSFQFTRASLLTWGGIGLTAILLGIVVATPILFPKPTLSASLSTDTLLSEYGNLPINIQLREITYDQTVNQTISSAITEVRDTKTQHLSSDLIAAEAKTAATPAASTTDVDALLNQVIK